MFPLQERILIRGAAAHVRAGLGVAADYEANYVPLYAPFDGRIEIYKEKTGGNWTRLIRDNSDRIEFAHLSKYLRKSGRVKEGEQIAVTGNTGTITTRSHKHIQIFRNGKRLDPEKYDWEASLKTTFMQITVVANKNSWLTKTHTDELNQFFKTHSQGRLEVVADIKRTDFNDIPLAPFAGLKAVDVNWYRENVTRLATGQITVFVMNPSDYLNGSTWGFMTYGDPKRPVRCEIASGDVISPSGTSVFTLQAFHEICHALFFLTGQEDRTHELIYQDPPNYSGIMDLVDFRALQNKLVTIKNEPMNQTKLVLGKDGRTVYEAKPIAISFEEYKKQASVEGIIVPNPIPKAADAL